MVNLLFIRKDWFWSLPNFHTAFTSNSLDGVVNSKKLGMNFQV